MNAERIPDIIIGRLPVYLRALQRLSDKGIQTTSSQELGEIVGISAAQIRKDISQFGEFGKQGTGYSIPFLIERLQTILKVDRVWDVVIVGMGCSWILRWVEPTLSTHCVTVACVSGHHICQFRGSGATLCKQLTLTCSRGKCVGELTRGLRQLQCMVGGGDGCKGAGV
jgi:hypothetical protein